MPSATSQRESRTEVKTVVFTDMAGFTQMQDELGERLAEEIIQRHKELARTVLQLHSDGQLVKEMGDGFILAFKVPSNAARFALQLQKKLPVFSREVRRPIQDRIAIHVGEISVEYYPGTDRIKDLHGIHVSICSRVQGLCKPGHILLTHAAFDNAWRQLKGPSIEDVGELNCKDHGAVKFKGVADPVRVHEIAELGGVEIVDLELGGKAERLADLGAADLPIMVEDEGKPSGSLWRRAKREIRRNWRHGAVGAAIAVAGSLLVIALPLGGTLTNLSYDLAYWVRPDARPNEAVIVYMNDDSKDELNESDLREWRRSTHARLIERVSHAGAQAIVFDLLFTSTNDVPSDPGGTARLVQAAARFPRTFAAGDEVVEQHNGVTIGTRIRGPFEELRRVVRWGVVQHLSGESMVRRHYRPHTDPTQLTLSEIVASAIANHSFSPSSRPRWMNYYGRPGTIPYLSYVNALDPTRSADASFSNKVVFVGAKYGTGFRGGRATDEFETPYYRATGDKSPGVEINATAFLNLFHRDWLTQATPWGELALLALFGGLSGFGLALLRPAMAAVCGLSLALLLALGSCLLVWRTNWWFSWTVLAFVQIPCALAWSMVSKSYRIEREKLILQKTLASHRTLLRSKSAQNLPSAGVPARADGANRPKPQIPDHKLHAIIGKGAYGEVWLAEDITGQFHAVKVIYADSFKTGRPYEREFEGVQKIASISRGHPGLIDILHVGRNETGHYFFYIMEAADDQSTGRQINPARYTPASLEHVIDQHAPVPTSECAKLALELLHALQFLHSQGLTHRDVKPANVLFVCGQPKLADIGLVTELAEVGSPVSLVGTPGYMAPEGPGAPSADIYSLGKVFYELATGKSVHDFPELPSWSEESSDISLFELNKVILKACALHPQDRYHSAEQMGRDLENFVRSKQPIDSP